MFNIIVRKANFIDVFLDDNVDIKNLIELKNIQSKSLSSNKKIRTYNDSEGNLYLEFTVLNNSIIDENIAVTWNISDYFWFNKDFNLEQKTIYSDSESHFTINLWKLPNYKWIFNINFNLIYKPDFKFSTDWINKDILQWWTLNEEFNLFLMPWKLIIWIIIVLIFIKVLFRSWKKYRQKNT